MNLGGRRAEWYIFFVALILLNYSAVAQNNVVGFMDKYENPIHDIGSHKLADGLGVRIYINNNTADYQYIGLHILSMDENNQLVPLVQKSFHDLTNKFNTAYCDVWLSENWMASTLNGYYPMQISYEKSEDDNKPLVYLITGSYNNPKDLGRDFFTATGKKNGKVKGYDVDVLWDSRNKKTMESNTKPLN